MMDDFWLQRDWMEVWGRGVRCVLVLVLVLVSARSPVSTAPASWRAGLVLICGIPVSA